MTTDRTPYCHKIRYGITGAPILTEDEMDGSHAPGMGVSPTLIELIYSAARDGKPATVSASVTGSWTRFGQPADGQVTTHFTNGPDGWPEWLAEEARLHNPDAAMAPQSVSRADVLRDAADALPEADLPFVPPMDRRRVADWLRRLAEEAQPAERHCTCSHPAGEHSIYGCADDCTCEWMPKRKPPMDPVHILGIKADEAQPGTEAQQDGARR